MPTILLLTANDPADHLNKLAAEGKEIQRTLNIAYGKGYDVVLVPETTTEDFIKELMVPGRQIEIVHYAGHAGGDSLRLTNTDAHASALAGKLRTQGTVKLVFLNGCATRGQVEFFHAAGIPFVFATNRQVGDEKAYWVATQFYQYLTLGRSLQEAFGEVVTDAQKLSKKVYEFRRNRSIGFDAGVAADDPIEWDLYVRPGLEHTDYRLPFTRGPQQPAANVGHTRFLDELIYALTNLESPVTAPLRHLKTTLERGHVPNNKKIAELLKVLPYTLGVRLRQITAEPDARTDDYYRELLYDYVFFFETLLHHTAALLFARIWEEERKTPVGMPDNTAVLRDFLTRNRLRESPESYVPVLKALLNRMEKAGVPNTLAFGEAHLHYLNSEAFISACNFFYLQKQYFAQRVRLRVDEALESCVVAQEHLIEAFRKFCFIAQYVMASVRDINVMNFRYVPTEFDNVMSKLLVPDIDPAPVPGHRMLENKSVLCFDTPDYDLDTPSLNLFPFIIDRNVFTGRPNNEVDLYLFIGYFAEDGGIAGKRFYHYVSAQNPGKIWRFDETQNHVSLLHVGEPASLIHEANHLMAGTWEFRSYINEFKKSFLPENH